MYGAFLTPQLYVNLHNSKFLNSFDFQAGERVGACNANPCRMRLTPDGRADRFSRFSAVPAPLSEHHQTLLLLLTGGAKIEGLAPTQAPLCVTEHKNVRRCQAFCLCQSWRLSQKQKEISYGIDLPLRVILQVNNSPTPVGR